jgi:hypothetical protein
MHAGILVGTPEGKRLREGLKPRWGDNINMDLNDIGWQRLDWINLVEDREKWRAVVNTVSVHNSSQHASSEIPCILLNLRF